MTKRITATHISITFFLALIISTPNLSFAEVNIDVGKEKQNNHQR